MTTSRYNLDSLILNPVDRSLTRLLYVSVSRYSEEWSSTLHTHPCAELFYITKGRGQLRFADRTIPLTVDDVIIVNSNVKHTEISSEDCPLEYLVLGIDNLEALAGVNGDDGYSIVHYQSDQEQLRFYLNSLLKEIEAQQTGYHIICQDLLEVVLLLIMRRSHSSISFVPSSGKSSQEAAIARRYIDNHFKENLTLDKLAAVAHVSKYYLAHTFSREYGTSPINYTLSRRIQESLYLLTDTSLTLSEIAGLLGFSSPSYFSQSFRRVRGMSPLQYRMQHRSKNVQK